MIAEALGLGQNSKLSVIGIPAAVLVAMLLMAPMVFFLIYFEGNFKARWWSRVTIMHQLDGTQVSRTDAHDAVFVAEILQGLMGLLVACRNCSGFRGWLRWVTPVRLERLAGVSHIG